MIRFKKTLTLFILIFLFTFIQSYWSMYVFQNTVDTIFIALFFSVFLILIYSIINYLKIKKSFKLILKIVFTVSIWFFMNLDTFRVKESAWSTYSFDEEIYYTIWFSKYPIIILISLLLFLENKISFNSFLQE